MPETYQLLYVVRKGFGAEQIACHCRDVVNNVQNELVKS